MVYHCMPCLFLSRLLSRDRMEHRASSLLIVPGEAELHVYIKTALQPFVKRQVRRDAGHVCRSSWSMQLAQQGRCPYLAVYHLSPKHVNNVSVMHVTLQPCIETQLYRECCALCDGQVRAVVSTRWRHCPQSPIHNGALKATFWPMNNFVNISFPTTFFGVIWKNKCRQHQQAPRQSNSKRTVYICAIMWVPTNS